jgi:hypothetical protein
VVAIPLQGFNQLGRAEAGTLETVAHGAADLLVGVAAEAELSVAVHPKKLWRRGKDFTERASTCERRGRQLRRAKNRGPSRGISAGA